MTALEELKAATRESAEAKREELARVIDRAIAEVREIAKLKEESRKALRDILLDIISKIRAPYETTVAQAREAETIDEVALLWKDTHAFYADWLKWWEGSRSIWFTEEEVFIYLDRLIKNLERSSAQAYEFHS
ncbi:MAG: hypothetical protein JOZ08_06120 [Verrucomicrobia bacterium]|nr:hypothetical protein [Verrucomicrobiota bacterium]